MGVCGCSGLGTLPQGGGSSQPLLCVSQWPVHPWDSRAVTGACSGLLSDGASVHTRRTAWAAIGPCSRVSHSLFSYTEWSWLFPEYFDIIIRLHKNCCFCLHFLNEGQLLKLNASKRRMKESRICHHQICLFSKGIILSRLFSRKALKIQQKLLICRRPLHL